MRFILDVHLGKLARDLRLLGVDAAWSDSAEDNELLKLSAAENRILLTRDRELSGRSPQAYFVKAIQQDAQLLEVLREYPPGGDVLRGERLLTRCLECNREFTEESSEAIRGRVPDQIIAEHAVIKRCPSCGQAFWEGSHARRMRERASGWLQLAQ